MPVTNSLRAIHTLRPDPQNARRHTKEQVDEIAKSIQSFGMVAPLVIRPDGTLIGGNATLEACKSLGHEKVNCRVVDDLTESQYRALGLALNRLAEHSEWDDVLLSDALRSIQVEDALVAGFSSADIAKIAAEPDPISVEEVLADEIAASALLDEEFWIAVRGPLEHQAVMLQRLREFAAELDSRISVDVGTVGSEAMPSSSFGPTHGSGSSVSRSKSPGRAGG